MNFSVFFHSTTEIKEPSRARVVLGIEKAFIRVTQIIMVLKPVVWIVDKKEVKNVTWPEANHLAIYERD